MDVEIERTKLAARLACQRVAVAQTAIDSMQAAIRSHEALKQSLQQDAALMDHRADVLTALANFRDVVSAHQMDLRTPGPYTVAMEQFEEQTAKPFDFEELKLRLAARFPKADILITEDDVRPEHMMQQILFYYSVI